MRTYPVKRIEIVVEAPVLSRLTRALREAGAQGFTVLPAAGGDGRSGPWSREGQVGAAGAIAVVVCLAAPEDAERLTEAAFAVLAPHIGVVSISDAEVIRPERFRRDA